MARQPTRLPSGLNDEGYFLTTSMISLTLRQLMALLGGGMLFYLGAEILNNFLPGPIAWVLALPILLTGVAFAFIKRKGRPIDDWLGDKLRFLIEPTVYTMRDPNAEEPESDEAEWTEEKIRG
ncbi:PrgI family protein [Miltoncostaea oceani]|uniref:PrgI family protein n=1 Tax=Miltoncostaea oceani TaxID=2843216 RepID=UPI001C3DC5BD|nr:PrgI family protein [Miltoncostaea oceani]